MHTERQRTRGEEIGGVYKKSRWVTAPRSFSEQAGGLLVGLPSFVRSSASRSRPGISSAHLCSQNLVLHSPGNTSWQPPYRFS